MPSALLLPGDRQLQYDLVPDRLQLRRGGHVRTDGVLSGDLRDVRGQENVRLVPRGTLLPGRDPVGAVSGGFVLPYRRVGADAVPCEPVLPAGVGQAQGVSGGQDVAGGEQVGQTVPMSGQRHWIDLEAHAPRQLWRRQGLCALCELNETMV